jgi:hypothetical protein
MKQTKTKLTPQNLSAQLYHVACGTCLWINSRGEFKDAIEPQLIGVGVRPPSAILAQQISNQTVTNTYIQTAYRKSPFPGAKQDLSLMCKLVPFFLSDKVIFTAMVARSILQREMADGQTRTPSDVATRAYGLAVGLLRRHLLSTADKVSDMVLCSTMFLASFNVRNMLTLDWPLEGKADV